MEHVITISSICFALCAIPQAWQCYKDKHASGLAYGFLALWTIGDVGYLWYALVQAMPGAFILNYAVNTACLAVMWRYRLAPRHNTSCLANK